VDPDVHHRVPSREDLACEMSYMGTYDPGRQEKLDELFLAPARAYPEKQFLLAGTLYPWNWSWPQNVRRFDHVSPGDHPALFSSSRCTLNITRAEMAENGYCPSGRFFEAAACGTPIVTDAWPGLDQFFSDGEEILIAENQYDVLSALSRGAHELARIAERARERALAEHTGERRARQLLAYIEGARHRAHHVMEIAS
jgi:spore maturation protein CgeB